MLRSLGFAAALLVSVLYTVGSAQSASMYCARFVGGTERMTSHVHAHCDYASLQSCRDAVRERGGGHCYRAGNLR